MPTLLACLNRTPRRTLLVIAQLQRLKPKSSATKAQLIDMLQRAMMEPDHQRPVRPLRPREVDFHGHELQPFLGVGIDPLLHRRQAGGPGHAGGDGNAAVQALRPGIAVPPQSDGKVGQEM